LLDESQYGFCSVRSTASDIVEDIVNATDNKNHTIGVFIDLKKAF